MYILGKHSTSVFSSNKNTEDGTDKNLLDENICSTGDFLQNNEDLFDETANQSELGENLALMPNESLDLLQHFEMSVIIYLHKHINLTESKLFLYLTHHSITTLHLKAD